MSMKTRFLACIGYLAGLAAASAQPSILFQPDSISVSPGANVFFQVLAFGDGAISYQWLKNNAPMPGQEADFIYLRNVSAGDAGEYQVIASSMSGSVTSGVAALVLELTFTKVTSGPLVTDPGSSLPASWGDYDNDGYPDVFIPKAASDFNYLYRNNGDGTFQRVLTGSPVTDYANTRSATWADYDNDGWLDLFVANSGIGGGGGFGGPVGNNVMYRNNRNGTFAVAALADFSEAGAANTSGAFADYDGDGFLDLAVGVNINANALYRNNGNGGMARVNAAPLTTDNFKNTSSVVWGDYNDDGSPDLLVVNQPPPFPFGNFRLGEEILYSNNGDGTFSRQTNNPIVTAGGVSLSGSWVDYDNDGDRDLFIANYSGQNSALFRNDGGGAFTRITAGEIVNEGSEGAFTTSAAWGDYDNDGWIDVFVTNDGAFGNFLYRNNGDGSFTETEAGSPASDRGNSFGCAWVDVNRDGALDLFVSNVSGENYLYRNNGGTNGWINIRLTGKQSNRFGVGAKVRVLATIKGVAVWQSREIAARDGAGSPNTLDAHFGLGDAAKVDVVRVEWPTGAVQDVPDVSKNQFLVVEEVPSIRLAPASRPEGDVGERSMFFTVSLTQPTNASVSVEFFTADGTAFAGEDYVGTNGTVVFAPNQTNQTIAITVLGDLADETNETFSVILTNSTVVPISRRLGLGTIIDDEPIFATVGDVTVTEGNGIGSTAVFIVELIKPGDTPISMEFATAAVSAAAGSDFTATNGVLVFSPGETTKPVVVPIVGDLLDEPSEVFTLNLTNAVNVILADIQASATILNDDLPPTVSVGNLAVAEGNAGTFQMAFDVNLSGPSGYLVSVQAATSNLTAQTGSDYIGVGAQTLSFAAGITNRKFIVTVIGDTAVEPNEVFLVNIFNAQNAILGSPGFGTINDDDFKLGSVLMGGNGFSLSFPTIAGRSYRVEWTGELSAGAVWLPLPGYENVIGTGADVAVVDPAAGLARRFYRVVQLSP